MFISDVLFCISLSFLSHYHQFVYPVLIYNYFCVATCIVVDHHAVSIKVEMKKCNKPYTYII